jgi:hypothetical protein
MTTLERLLHDAHVRFQHEQLRPQRIDVPSTEIRGVKFCEPQSRTWLSQHRDYRPAGYYRIHCSHDRLLWDTCATCKRDKREANANFGKMARGDRF